MGRATKYHTVETPRQARKLAMLGLTQAEMAKFFEVTTRTFENWLATHDELHDAVKMGGAVADAKVAESLYKRAIGYKHKAVKIMQYEGVPIEVDYIEHYPPDTTACIFWLKNRRVQSWRSVPDPNGGEADLPPTKVIFEVRDGRSPNRQGQPEPAAG